MAGATSRPLIKAEAIGSVTDLKRNWRYSTTLAAALAETRDFEQAAAVQQRAVDSAPPAVAKKLRRLLAKYRDHQAHRMPAVEEPSSTASDRSEGNRGESPSPEADTIASNHRGQAG